MTVANKTGRTQLVATNLQTVFTAQFGIDDETFVSVYQRIAADSPDDATDILTLTTEYTVSAITNESFTVTLVTGAATGDIVTLVNNQVPSRTTSFTTAGTLTAANLNSELDHLILVFQNIFAENQKLGLAYQNSAVIADKDRELPILSPDQTWIMNSAGTAISRTTLTSGTISGALLDYNNLSDVDSASSSRTNLGLDTMATQAASAVAITGGTIDSVAITNGTIEGAAIGGVTPAAGDFTTLTASGNSDLGDGVDTFKINSSTPAIDTILDEDTLVSDSATALATQQSIKAYVDSNTTNLHDPCVAATTANFSSSYDNGASGVGATLTQLAAAVDSPDGVALTVGDRVLVGFQTAPAENGVYTVSQVGTGSFVQVYTRATDYDLAAEINPGDRFHILLGTLYASTQWIMTQTAAITIGTTAITFAEQVVSDALLSTNNLSDVASAATSRTSLAVLSSAEIQLNSANFDVDTGSADAYVVTLSPVPAAYVGGLFAVMEAANSNTGASTININGLGAIPLETHSGTALALGNIYAGDIYYIVVNNAGTVATILGINVNIADQSTGLSSGGVLTTGTAATEYSIASGVGQIVSTDGVKTQVSWAAKPDLTPAALLTHLITFTGIDSSGVLVEQTSAFTNIQLRTIISLGVVVHVNKTTVDAVNNEQHSAFNAVNQLNDLAKAIGFFNVSGNLFSANGANLNIDKSAGDMYGIGVNYINSALNPNVLTLAVLTALSFQYRYSDGSNGVTGIAIDPDNIDDLAGGLSALANNKWSVQRAYSFTSNNVKIQRGQASYGSVDAAIAGIGSDAFVTEPSIAANGLLRGYIVAVKGATDLSDTTQARFIEASKFQASAGGIGSSAATLQEVYDNSAANPEILTNTTQSAVTLRRGSAADTDDVLEVQNNAGTQKFGVTGEGVTSLVGVTFPAAQVASADVNTLDDYQEGTWTPTSADAITAGNTGTTGTGRYTKVGDVVYYSGFITNIDTTGMTAGNDFFVQGLPFTSATITYGVNGSVVADTVAFAGSLTCSTSASTSLSFTESTTAAAIDNLIVSELTSTTSDLSFTGFYFV